MQPSVTTKEDSEMDRTSAEMEKKVGEKSKTDSTEG